MHRAAQQTSLARPLLDPGLFLLDPEVVHLNHGSFGACPRSVLETQARLRERLERDAIAFLDRELFERLDDARATLAAFVGARPRDLVFVSNATTGVNAVLRSLRFRPGDELLCTSHGYGACTNALTFVAERDGARVRIIDLPFPLADPAQVTERVLEALSHRSRLLLIDHVTSPTGLVLPLEEIVPEAERRGVRVLVDGAHGPGMLDLDLTALAPSYYTGNWHKWCCAPKGTGLLWVREDRQAEIHPAVISHGLRASLPGRSRLHLEFDWVGTMDPTPHLCAAEAVRTLEARVPGGWPALRRRNRALALAARDLLCEALGTEPPAPDTMIGTLASVPLPPGEAAGPHSPFEMDPLQRRLHDAHRIVAPVVSFPSPPARQVRLSAHAYNHLPEYEHLAQALRTEL